MASSKHPLGAEGSSSSESGWTMYIASPTPMGEEEEEDVECSEDQKSDDDDDKRRRHITNHNHLKKKEDDDDSDDSLASDASSGGSSHRHHTQYSRGQDSGYGHGTSRNSKQDKSYMMNKFSSRKNGNKQEKKRVENSSRKK